MDTGAGRTHRVGIVEEGRTGRGLQDQGFPEHVAAGQFENKEVLGLHSLLLDAYIYFFNGDGGVGRGVEYFFGECNCFLRAVEKTSCMRIPVSSMTINVVIYVPEGAM